MLGTNNDVCSLSSVGQSNRLITGGSKVRILEGAPFYFNIWVGGRVAKGGRLWSLVKSKPKIAAHTSDCMMNTGLIRGTLNRWCWWQSRARKEIFECRDFIPGILKKDKEKVQTTNIIKMVVKTIVVRNLFSFEYEGSNPSLPTNLESYELQYVI